MTIDPIKALEVAVGYMRIAEFDLSTGAPKRTALRTIEDGLKRAEVALAANRPEPA